MDFKKIKSWGPEIEKEIVSKWKKSELFKFSKSSNKKNIFHRYTPSLC